jgi:hypothetical protein
MIMGFYLKQDRIDIFIRTTGWQGNTKKKNGTVLIKTVCMVSLLESSPARLSTTYSARTDACGHMVVTRQGFRLVIGFIGH